MLTTLNCATGSLAVYQPSADQPWDQRRIKHLYRRLGYGPTPDELEAALELSPQQVVDQLIDQIVDQPLPDPPEWAGWTYEDYDPDSFDDMNFQQVNGYIGEWVERMIQEGPREKLSLFWHNHFVTRYESYYCPSYLYQYHSILQEYALGNFKEMVYRIGTTPAMLIFLNGLENNKFSPNENYARELFELFTLGENNGYTQQDIVEASRALTGWNDWQGFCAPIGFRVQLFDSGQKTIFGQTYNFNHQTLIDLLFEQRGEQVAHFICSKIYRNFVNTTVDENVVAGLAQTFRENNWELAPVFRQLFRSEHFFDDYNIGTLIKSPVDMLISLIREGQFAYNNDVRGYVRWAAFNLGQNLFDPVDVAGWPGNRAWIDSNRLTGRWSMTDAFLGAFFQLDAERIRQLAIQLTDNSNSPEVIVQALVDYFLPNGLVDAAAYETATGIFKWEVPQNYYDNGQWNLGWDSAPYQVVLTLSHLARYPEFQLV